MSICTKTFNLFVEDCDTEDPPIVTKFFSPGVNDFFQTVIPVNKGGIYQIRYVSGSMIYGCSASPPAFQVAGAFIGEVRILRNAIAETASWIQSNWIGNLFAHAGAIAHAGFSLNGDHIVIFEKEGFPGIFGFSSDNSAEPWVEQHLTNLALPARYQKFCFEKSLSAGETVRFEFNQDMLTLCGGAGVPVFHGNQTQIQFLRVSHC